MSAEVTTGPEITYDSRLRLVGHGYTGDMLDLVPLSQDYCFPVASGTRPVELDGGDTSSPDVARQSYAEARIFNGDVAYPTAGSTEVSVEAVVDWSSDIESGEPEKAIKAVGTRLERQAHASGMTVLDVVSLATSHVTYALPDSTSGFSPFIYTLTKAERMRARIRANMAGFKGNHKHLTRVAKSDPEYKARELLRDMVGDVPFRSYLKKGFVTVRGRSGLVYQVMRGQMNHSVRSFAPTKNGRYKPFESLCIVFKDHDLPLTDSVVMRVMMCLYDEFGMRANANVWPAAGSVKDEEYVLGKFGELAKARRSAPGDSDSVFDVARDSDYLYIPNGDQQARIA